MAVSMFTRFGNVRNVMNITNISAIGGALNIKQCSNVISRSCFNSTKEIETLFDDVYNENSGKKVSKAMRMYLKRAEDYGKFVESEIAKYEIGKRHLANMMGEDPLEFEQEDIDKAIEYLLPSGIYDWRARPMLQHPEKLFEKRKEAEFDESGRPYHFLFYTCKPSYYEVLHRIAEAMNNLNKEEDKLIMRAHKFTASEKCDTEGTRWLTKDELETKLMEELSIVQYTYLIGSFNKVLKHPLSQRMKNFIMEYRKELKTSTEAFTPLPVQHDSNGRPFVVVERCMRKTARAVVKVIDQGSGNITINGKDILYFRDVQAREQMTFTVSRWHLRCLEFCNETDACEINRKQTKILHQWIGGSRACESLAFLVRAIYRSLRGLRTDDYVQECWIRAQC